MVELVPGSNVYITQSQMSNVLSGLNTRTKFATRLLRCFHTSDELKELQSYRNVDGQVKDAIEGWLKKIKKHNIKLLRIKL